MIKACNFVDGCTLVMKVLLTYRKRHQHEDRDRQLLEICIDFEELCQISSWKKPISLCILAVKKERENGPERYGEKNENEKRDKEIGP